MLALGALVVTGCQGLAGTWLFMIEPTADISGDCADGGTDSGFDSDYEYTYSGDEAVLIDIYELNDGTWAVETNPVMIGTLDGGTLSAEHSETFSLVYTDGSEEYSETETDWIQGDYSSGSMTGSFGSDYSRYDRQDDDEDTYSCKTKVAFSAEQVTSNGEAYVGAE